MNSVIVTITDIEKTFSYDFEIPRESQFAEVYKQIIEAVSMIDPQNDINETNRVINERTGLEIKKDRTIEENGIWTGDYLIYI